MKKIYSLFLVLLIALPMLAFAQEKMTEKEAQEELVRVKAELADAEARIEELEIMAKELDAEVGTLQARYDELTAQLETLKKEWELCQYGRYKVVEGDWLSKIAGMRNVYHKGAQWPMIYEANKEKVKNPNLIYPGWVLLIPTLDKYSVIPGDCLYLIASYLSIYSNAKRWPEIYEANKDKIKDRDMIYPRQEFIIPHE
ncbi:hypothetical protein A2Y85_06505 [candidate division WOR-3 bacterium RBG_13_43_14]|uniref:LysM domain-containing protein n=1 Tax=candidate division WOR-3 bacterium RBG_13_43_14 TaxID=1802590 RepID=A0A1F4UAM7_UNCW3|nr:MAG: hypothetical protein A2Y85_06505 [candidate division WOR-3 bacterium RBG_13_43_14]